MRPTGTHNFRAIAFTSIVATIVYLPGIAFGQASHPSQKSSKERLEIVLEPLKPGQSRCQDIESHLATSSISFSVWDHGAKDDGTKRYTIMIRRPDDNSLWDRFMSRTLSAELEVKDCTLESKNIHYNYK